MTAFLIRFIILIAALYFPVSDYKCKIVDIVKRTLRTQLKPYKCIGRRKGSNETKDKRKTKYAKGVLL